MRTNALAIKRNPGAPVPLIEYPRDTTDTPHQRAYVGRAWRQRGVHLGGAPAVEVESTATRTELGRRIGQLAILGKLGGSTAWSETLQYARDVVGNPEIVDRTGHPLAARRADYNYDGLHRLATTNFINPFYAAEYTDPDGATTAEDLRLDTLGNRETYVGRDGVTVAYTHDDVNEYTSITHDGAAPFTPTYTANGNLARNEQGIGFEYDYENRLTKILAPQAEGGQPLAEFTYDALGRRTSEVRTDAVASSTTYYYYDGQRVAAEYNGGGALLRYYVHGDTYVDERAVLHDATTGRDYAYVLDGLYNVVGVVDDQGTLIQASLYDAFCLPQFRPLIIGVRNHLGDSVPDPDPDGLGNLDLDASGTINLVDLALATAIGHLTIEQQPYAFQGRRLSVYQTPGGLTLPIYDFRARVLDPVHGRFMQRDPAEYVDSYNLYLAMAGNPLTSVDPTGKFSFTELLAVVTTQAVLFGAHFARGAGSLFQRFVNFANALSLRSLYMELSLRLSQAAGAASQALHRAARAFSQLTLSNAPQNTTVLKHSLEYVTRNPTKVQHIFGKAAHNLAQFGDQTVLLTRVINNLMTRGLNPGQRFKDVPVVIDGITVFVRGFVTPDGVIKIGTMFAQ